MACWPAPPFTPIRLDTAAAPWNHPDWLFELKYDGFRALAFIENGSARLVSRNGNTFKTFSGLCSAIPPAIRARSAVLAARSSGPRVGASLTLEISQEQPCQRTVLGGLLCLLASAGPGPKRAPGCFCRAFCHLQNYVAHSWQHYLARAVGSYQWRSAPSIIMCS